MRPLCPHNARETCSLNHIALRNTVFEDEVECRRFHRDAAAGRCHTVRHVLLCDINHRNAPVGINMTEILVAHQSSFLIKQRREMSSPASSSRPLNM